MRVNWWELGISQGTRLLPVPDWVMVRGSLATHLDACRCLVHLNKIPIKYSISWHQKQAGHCCRLRSCWDSLTGTCKWAAKRLRVVFPGTSINGWALNLVRADLPFHWKMRKQKGSAGSPLWDYKLKEAFFPSTYICVFVLWSNILNIMPGKEYLFNMDIPCLPVSAYLEVGCFRPTTFPFQGE